MSFRITSLRVARRRVFVGATVAAAALAGAVFVACSGRSAGPSAHSPSRAQNSTSGSSAASYAAPPKECQPATCRSQQSMDVGDGYLLRLRTGQGTGNLPVPVLELDHGNRAVDWWVSQHGAADGSLTCMTTDSQPGGKHVAQCAVLATTGAHAGSAELVFVTDGHLKYNKDSYIISDTPFIRAADLDGDGYLDVIAGQNDYQPSFALGHVYEQTFRYTDGRFVSTGCSARKPSGTPWFTPAGLLTDRCPTQGPSAGTSSSTR